MTFFCRISWFQLWLNIYPGVACKLFVNLIFIITKLWTWNSTRLQPLATGLLRSLLLKRIRNISSYSINFKRTCRKNKTSSTSQIIPSTISYPLTSSTSGVTSATPTNKSDTSRPKWTLVSSTQRHKSWGQDFEKSRILSSWAKIHINIWKSGTVTS